MLFIKFFPRTIRLAMFYTKALKISKDKSLDKSEKLSAIRSLEKKCGGQSYFTLKANKATLYTLTRAIGKKDIGRVYVSIESPAEAFSYLDSALYDFNFIKIEGKEKTIVENKSLVLMYLGMANALLGRTDKAIERFDELNLYLNDAICKDPSNDRLTGLYNYCIQNTFDAILKIAKRFPDKQQNIYKGLLNLLKEFDKRDPGNETIQEYLSRFH